MSQFTRRQLMIGFVASGAAMSLAAGHLAPAKRAVIIGGGPAGAAAAVALALSRPDMQVVLIESDPTRFAQPRAQSPVAQVAPFSRPGSGVNLETLKHSGIAVLLDQVTEIDWRAARLSLFSGRSAPFDALYLAPGTAPVDERITGLDPVARSLWPAAWGNAREARRLSAQLSILPEGGHVVLRLPGAGLSHPDVAVERALALARHLRQSRPKAQLTVLDGGTTPLLLTRFEARSRALGLSANTRWLTAPFGGTVQSIDALRGWIETSAGRLRADVVNFVPPHGAGVIARRTGLTDASQWCPCDGTGKSTRQPGAVILGDARAHAVRTISGALASATVAAI